LAAGRTIATLGGSGDEGLLGIAGEHDQVLDDRAVFLLDSCEPRVLHEGLQYQAGALAWTNPEPAQRGDVRVEGAYLEELLGRLSLVGVLDEALLQEIVELGRPSPNDHRTRVGWGPGRDKEMGRIRFRKERRGEGGVPAGGGLETRRWVLGDLHDRRHRGDLVQRRLKFRHFYTCDTQRPQIALHVENDATHAHSQPPNAGEG
jgi:hypothetical protein